MGALGFFILCLLAVAGLYAGSYFGLIARPKRPAQLSLSLVDLAIGFAIVMLMAPLLATALAIVILLVQHGKLMFGADAIEASQDWFVILVVVLQFLLLLSYVRVPKVSLFRFFGGPDGRLISGFLRGVALWACIFPLFFVTSYLLQEIVQAIWGVETQEQQVVEELRQASGQPWLFWSRVALIGLLIPTVEEMLFRGILHPAVRSKLGTNGTVLCSTVIFALVHAQVAIGISNLVLLPSLGVLAYFLAQLYEQEENLWSCIGLHATFNTVTCLVVFQGG